MQDLLDIAYRKLISQHERQILHIGRSGAVAVFRTTRLTKVKNSGPSVQRMKIHKKENPTQKKIFNPGVGVH